MRILSDLAGLQAGNRGRTQAGSRGKRCRTAGTARMRPVKAEELNEIRSHTIEMRYGVVEQLPVYLRLCAERFSGQRGLKQNGYDEHGRKPSHAISSLNTAMISFFISGLSLLFSRVFEYPLDPRWSLGQNYYLSLRYRASSTEW